MAFIVIGSNIPCLCTPQRHLQWLLVDGGVRDQVPVTILRQASCDKIFAINVNKITSELVSNYYD